MIFIVAVITFIMMGVMVTLSVQLGSSWNLLIGCSNQMHSQTTSSIPFPSSSYSINTTSIHPSTTTIIWTFTSNFHSYLFWKSFKPKPFKPRQIITFTFIMISHFLSCSSFCRPFEVKPKSKAFIQQLITATVTPVFKAQPSLCLTLRPVQVETRRVDRLHVYFDNNLPHY